jgi:caspase domain-containing protein
LVRLELVQRTMERETSTNILFMDACRDNPLARNLARALGTRSTQIGRGLAPVESGEGTLIGFSTQPGNVALDGEGRNSPYAEALLKHIATPGDDLPTILINVRNDVMRATRRKQVPWEHSAMTARFYFIPPKPAGDPIELEFWASVKDSTSPAVLGTYLERYPDGEFAPIARALIEHYQQQLKAELAAREQTRKREEEERKAAEVMRLEEERRAREAAIAEERKRAEEAKSATDISRLDEQAKAEWLARTNDLRKALEEARLAREAAAAAEKQRLGAVKAAEQAMKTAEQTIAAKREAEKTGDPLKIAALPKLGDDGKRAEEDTKRSKPFDGTWHVRRIGPTCEFGQDVLFLIVVNNGVVQGLSAGQQRIRGTLSASGQITFRHVSADRNNKPVGNTAVYSGSLKGASGSGTFAIEGGPCKGTFTASRG